MFWVDSVYIDEEGQMANVVITREGHQGRADIVGEYRCLVVNFKLPYFIRLCLLFLNLQLISK
jgi:hypothetical protein